VSFTSETKEFASIKQSSVRSSHGFERPFQATGAQFRTPRVLFNLLANTFSEVTDKGRNFCVQP
jgi:hypothetical protein